MELRHLRAFLAVADAGTFTAAAQRLRIAQPALSRQVRGLEEELGVALFSRDGRGAALTAAGMAFLPEARTIVDRSDAAVRAARSAGAGECGTLRVGYVWGLFHAVVPRALAGFRAAHPGVAVHLLDLTAAEQRAALESGGIDLALPGFAGPDLRDDWTRLVLGETGFRIALPEGHPAARKTRLALASLNAEMFVTISESAHPGAARWVAEQCAAAGFKPRSLQTADRGQAVLGHVAAGCGVALVPEPLAAIGAAGVVFRRVEPEPRARLTALWDPRRSHAGAGAFARLVRSRMTEKGAR